MPTKKIIQVVVILVAFGGSGFVLYNGLFRKSTPASLVTSGLLAPAPAPVSGIASGGTNPLLPYGKTFDLSGVLEKQRLQFGIISYPVLNTSTDVGVPTENLIKPQTQ